MSEPIAARVVTVSNRCASGEREDVSGALGERVLIAAGYTVTRALIPDGAAQVRMALGEAIAAGARLIVTTGGTGLSPRDTTPEATLGVIEKRLPGFEAAMLLASLAKTPHAMLSRATAGTVGRAIVINVPGSPKAVRETLAAVMAAIPHGLDKLRGDPSDCGQG